MSDDFSRFLQSGPDIVREKDAQLQTERKQREAAEIFENNKRNAIKAQWDTARSAINGVVFQVNEAFKSVGVSLRDEDEPEPSPAIAKLTVGIYRNDVYSGHTLILNVTGNGAQQVVFAGVGEKRSFELPALVNCGAKQYAELLMRFMEPTLKGL